MTRGEKAIIMLLVTIIAGMVFYPLVLNDLRDRGFVDAEYRALTVSLLEMVVPMFFACYLIFQGGERRSSTKVGS